MLPLVARGHPQDMRISAAPPRAVGAFRPASSARDSLAVPQAAAVLAAEAAKQAMATFGICVLLGASVLAPMPAMAKTDGAAIGMCLITKAPCAPNPCRVREDPD